MIELLEIIRYRKVSLGCIIFSHPNFEYSGVLSENIKGLLQFVAESPARDGTLLFSRTLTKTCTDLFRLHRRHTIGGGE